MTNIPNKEQLDLISNFLNSTDLYKKNTGLCKEIFFDYGKDILNSFNANIYHNIPNEELDIVKRPKNFKFFIYYALAFSLFAPLCIIVLSCSTIKFYRLFLIKTL